MKKAKKVITGYISDIIGNSIYDILKFIFMNIVGVSLSFYITQKVVPSYAPIIVIVFLTIITTILTVALILLTYKKHRKYKFRILSMYVNFEYMGDKIKISTESTVRAKRSNLDGIYNRYTWFSDEKSSVRCLTTGMEIKHLSQKDTSNEYSVQFGRMLRKGDEITYKTEVICENKHNHFKNFYSREIIAPQDHLAITVVIPSKYGFNKIERSKFIGSAYNNSSESETFAFLNTYTWVIDEKPKLGYEYKLLWKKE